MLENYSLSLVFWVLNVRNNKFEITYYNLNMGFSTVRIVIFLYIYFYKLMQIIVFTCDIVIVSKVFQLLFEAWKKRLVPPLPLEGSKNSAKLGFLILLFSSVFFALDLTRIPCKYPFCVFSPSKGLFWHALQVQYDLGGFIRMWLWLFTSFLDNKVTPKYTKVVNIQKKNTNRVDKFGV